MKHLDFVDCIFRDQEVGGSNPLAPTNPFGTVRRHGLHNVPDTWVTPFGVASAQLPSRTKVRRAALLLSVLCRIARIFPVPLEVMPPRKIRSTSSVLRNFLAMIQGRPFLVSFELGGRTDFRAVPAPESPDQSIPDHTP